MSMSAITAKMPDNIGDSPDYGECEAREPGDQYRRYKADVGRDVLDGEDV